jgi:hypothetical protein
MSSPHLDLRLPWRSPSPPRIRFALQLLSKWHQRIWIQIQALLVHAEHVDAPLLDGMRWCDEVERRLNASLIGERTRLDSGPRATNKQIPN